MTTEKQALINQIVIALVSKYQFIDMNDFFNDLKNIFKDYTVQSAAQLIDEDNRPKDLMETFCKAKKVSGLSDGTIKQYRLVITQLLNSCKKEDLADVTNLDINNFILEKKATVSAVTLKTKYLYISSVFTWLFTHRYIAINPIIEAEKPKANVIYKKGISKVDLEKIHYYFEQLEGHESLRNIALLDTFLSTGCRVSELVGITLKNIDLQNKSCKVLGKGSKERNVILSDSTLFRIQMYLKSIYNTDNLEKIIHDYPDRPLFTVSRGNRIRKLSKEAISHVVYKASKDLGIEFTCHSFRRYFATKLKQDNVNIQIIAGLLGHSNLNQLNRYVLYKDHEMEESARNSVA